MSEDNNEAQVAPIRSYGGRGGSRIQRGSNGRGGSGRGGWGSMGRPTYANLDNSRIQSKKDEPSQSSSQSNKVNLTRTSRASKSAESEILSDKKDESPYMNMSAEKLTKRMRFSHLLATYPRVPLYVLQCCSSDAEGLTAKETEEFFESKFLPIQHLIVDERAKQVTELTKLIQQQQEQKEEEDKKLLLSLSDSKFPMFCLSSKNFTSEELQPGLLIMRNILPFHIQQQFINLSFALGTPNKKKLE